MEIDFTPLKEGLVTPIEFASKFTQNDLRAAINTYLDLVRDLVKDFNDPQLTFEPEDPNANDPVAKTQEELNMAWSLAHLVLHVTASVEEGAAFSSLLARGVPVENRLRYEPDWRTVTTRAQVLHRIEESRRMCLAYLDTWPDEPHLDVYRKFAADSPHGARIINAPAQLLSGLRHLAGHIDQFKDAGQQARAAVQTVR